MSVPPHRQPQPDPHLRRRPRLRAVRMPPRAPSTSCPRRATCPRRRRGTCGAHAPRRPGTTPTSTTPPRPRRSRRSRRPSTARSRPTPRVHRGAGFASRLTSAWYEQARDEVARLRRRARGRRRSSSPARTTDSCHLLSTALPRRTTVFVFGTEHHSTLLPWGRLHTVRLPVPGRRPRTPQALLEEALAGTTRRAHRARRRRRRLQRHRRGLAGRAARRHRPPARRPGRRSTPPSSRRTAPIDLAALGRRLRRVLGPQDRTPPTAPACSPVARDWLDAAQPYLAGGGATAQVTEDGTRWATGAGPPRGRQPQRARRRSPSPPPARRSAPAPRGDRGPRGPAHRAAARTACAASTGVDDLLDLRRRHRPRPGRHLHRRRARQPRSWPRPSRPSTASACGTASSARTCSSTPCSTRGPTSTTPRCGSAPGLANTAEHVERLLAAVATLAADGPGADYEHTASRAGSRSTTPRDLSAPLPW